MSTCQIAFAYKNRVICLEEFTSNTPNVLQKMKTAVWTHLPMDNGKDIVMETMCAGSLVTIKSDQDASKYIFGCAVDGKAKVKVKISRKQKDVKEKPSKSTMMEKSACVFVDQEFIRKLVELLDSWADKEISYEDTYALVEALKASILAREALVSLIRIPGRFLDGYHEYNWTIPSLLCKIYDSWITEASQEQLLCIIEQLPTVLDKLVSRRGKLFEDVFVKQKVIKQILKIRLPKSKLRVNDDQKENRSFRKQIRSIEENGFGSEEFSELKQDALLAGELQKPAKRLNQISNVSLVKEEAGTVSESEQEHAEEKERKRQARLVKRMEKSGCKTIEELKALEAVKKEAKLAKALEKYGCATEEELRQVRLEKRSAKKLERYGCQNEEELKQVKLAKKLAKYGCQTIEELNDLKKQTKLSKSKLPEYS